MKKIQIYDTTLRDGSQGENISFSLEDKLHITRKLDDLGLDYIEGGWPGSNSKDVAFFERAQDLKLKHAKLAAFGSTRHPRHAAAHDPNLQALIDANTPVVTIFGKTWDLHVKVALGVTLKENLDLIRESVAFLKSKGREVVYDAEHFFDGYKADSAYALATLKAAEEAGADILVLCDTNGGTLTADLLERFEAASRHVKSPLGIHSHNDCEMAVANAITAVQHGAVQVQGTINGYGERCGNANLCSVIANIELKLGMHTIGKESLKHLTAVSHYVSELANLPPRQDLAYVGKSAFAHKGGIHVSAVMKDASAYEHVDPAVVGNERRVLVSELSGKSNVIYKAEELGLRLDKSSLPPRWWLTSSRRWNTTASSLRALRRPLKSCSTSWCTTPKRFLSWTASASSPRRRASTNLSPRPSSSCASTARKSTPPWKVWVPSVPWTGPCGNRSQLSIPVSGTFT